jgi:hypothetical protein
MDKIYKFKRSLLKRFCTCCRIDGDQIVRAYESSISIEKNGLSSSSREVDKLINVEEASPIIEIEDEATLIDRDNLVLPQNSTNINVGGMPQSGSTMLFNMLRYILELKGVQYYGFYEDWFTVGSLKNHNIIKYHKYNKNLHSQSHYLITTKRNLLDTVASGRRRGDKRSAKELAEERIHCYASTMYYSDYEMEYETYISDPIGEIKKIANVINKSLNCQEAAFIKQKLDELKQKKLPLTDDPKSEAYKKSLLSQSHFSNDGKTNGYKGILASSEISEIVDAFPAWFEANPSHLPA